MWFSLSCLSEFSWPPAAMELPHFCERDSRTDYLRGSEASRLIPSSDCVDDTLRGLWQSGLHLDLYVVFGRG